MHTSRPGTGDLIAGAGGVLLLFSLFLPWYGAEINVAGVEASGEVSAWEVMGFIDVLLFLLAIVAIAVVAARTAGSLPAGVPGPLLLAAAGALGLALVLFRLIDIPLADVQAIPGDSVEIGREIGIFVALIAAAAIAYGGRWADRLARSTRLGRVRRDRSIRIAAPPAGRGERRGAPGRSPPARRPVPPPR